MPLFSAKYAFDAFVRCSSRAMTNMKIYWSNQRTILRRIFLKHIIVQLVYDKRWLLTLMHMNRQTTDTHHSTRARFSMVNSCLWVYGENIWTLNSSASKLFQFLLSNTMQQHDTGRCSGMILNYNHEVSNDFSVEEIRTNVIWKHHAFSALLLERNLNR